MIWTSILSVFKLENLKTILITAAIVASVIFWKDYQFQKSENSRQTENMSQIRKMDSLKFASQTYDRKEIDEFLEYQRKDLQEFLKDNKISTRKIEKIITQRLKYLDTMSRKQDLSPILQAIRESKTARVAVQDSTNCLIVKGWVVFENDSLSLDITERKFTNITDVVSYWERNQWSFLGIKTRLFGRKKATVIIKDDCGTSRTIVIDKRK